MPRAVVKWIHDNPGAARDESGYWTSAERRFSIHPNYRSTIYPDGYTVRDQARIIDDRGVIVQTGTLNHHGRYVTARCDTVRDAKQWAQNVIDAEWAKEVR